MYATVNDIEVRWRTLSADEQTKAAALISDATAIIDSLAVDTSECEEDWDELAKVVTCNMVIRAMAAGQSDSYGLSQSSMTAGPYTQSWSYANPSGDMYLTKLEKRMLGITSGYIGSIEPAINRYSCGCCHD